MADDSTFIPTNASEAEVADIIVNARKSWRTVKGKSETVWPPHLERSLVKALLQYKPTDLRYARALGRFPKRNRFISDSIYAQTGVRRTPKQVGSRLQQLKDVNCGKQLLDYAANTSLGPGPCQAPLGSFNGQQNISINPLTGVFEDGSLSPTSLVSHLRTPFNHGSGNGVDGASLASPLNSSFCSPVSAFGSLPITPKIKRLDVFLQYDPSSSSKYMQQQQRRMTQGRQARPALPLMRFSGCLARPESIRQAGSDSGSGGSGVACKAIWEREPVVTFTAREVVAAQCVVRVLTSDRMVLEETHPLVCVAMPAVSVSASRLRSRSLAVSDTGSGSCGDDSEDEDDCDKVRARNRSLEQFVYKSRLVSGAAWQAIRCDHDVSRYTITQDLVYQFDTPSGWARETFLSIVYHFVPTTTAAVQQQSATDPGMMIPAKPVRGVGLGTTSPASSSPSSRSSGSSESPSMDASSDLTTQQRPLFLNHRQQSQYKHQRQRCFGGAYSGLAYGAEPVPQRSGTHSQMALHQYPHHPYCMQQISTGLTSERGASTSPISGLRNYPTATDLSAYPLSTFTQDPSPVDSPLPAYASLYGGGWSDNLSACSSEVGSMDGAVCSLGAPGAGPVDFATAFSVGNPILG